MKRIEYGSKKHHVDYKFGNGFPRHIINSLDVSKLSMKFHPYNRKLRTDWDGRWTWMIPSSYIESLITKYIGKPYSELASYLDKVLKDSKIPSQYNADYWLGSYFSYFKGIEPRIARDFWVNDEGIVEKHKEEKRKRRWNRPWRKSFINWNNSQKVQFPPSDSVYLQHRKSYSMAWKERKGEYKWYLGTFWCKIDNKFYKLPVYDVLGLKSYHTDSIPSSRFWWEKPKEKTKRVSEIEELYVIPEICIGATNPFTEYIPKEIPNPSYPTYTNQQFYTINIGAGTMYPTVLKEDYERAKNKNLGR